MEKVYTCFCTDVITKGAGLARCATLPQRNRLCVCCKSLAEAVGFIGYGRRCN